MRSTNSTPGNQGRPLRENPEYLTLNSFSPPRWWPRFGLLESVKFGADGVGVGMVEVVEDRQSLLVGIAGGVRGCRRRGERRHSGSGRWLRISGRRGPGTRRGRAGSS